MMQKYTSFKTDELQGVMRRVSQKLGLDPEILDAVLDGIVLRDAEVIRKKDLLAGPALLTYASSVQTAIEVLKEAGITNPPLENIRDHFFEAAQEADNYKVKRLPN